MKWLPKRPLPLRGEGWERGPRKCRKRPNPQPNQARPLLQTPSRPNSPSPRPPPLKGRERSRFSPPPPCAPAPPTYLDAARPIRATIFGQAFGLTGAARVIDLCFAIVTTPRERLTLEQRIPHIDGAEPGRVAMVHFLSEADHGGTAFFRHRSTGFETIGPDRTAAYYATLDREVRRDGPPPADYIRGSTAQFECLCEVVAKPNRAVFYRSALLHSGVIPPDLPLSPDPRVGRLTITGFFAAR